VKIMIYENYLDGKEGVDIILCNSDVRIDIILLKEDLPWLNYLIV